MAATAVALDVLSLTNNARSTHGLRQQDYQRYREYCARRIHRVRKLTGLLQGKKRYEKKPVTLTSLADARSLQILLFEAERSWAYAMQLKADSLSEPRKKHHLIKRLCKAASSAHQLQELCQGETVDSQTSLEIQAYSLRLSAYVKFERQQWQEALDMFASSRSIYEKLALVAMTASQATLCQAAMDEIDPNIRYCAYNLKFKAGQSDDIESLLELRKKSGGPGQDLLSAKIESLLSERMHAKARTIHSISWRGIDLNIHNEDLMTIIMEIQDLSAKIDSGLLAEPVIVNNKVMEERLTMVMGEYDNLLGLGWDAAKLAERSIKDDMVATAKVKSSKSDNHTEMLRNIHSFVVYTRLTHTFDRSMLLVQANSLRLRSLITLTGTTEKRPSLRREELVKLNIALLGTVNEMSALPIGLTDVSLGLIISSKSYFCVAQRLVYTADIYIADHKYTEALTLLDKSSENMHLSQADLAKVNPKSTEYSKTEISIHTRRLEALGQSLRIRASIIRAHAYLASTPTTHSSLSDTVGNLSLETLDDNADDCLEDSAAVADVDRRPQLMDRFFQVDGAETPLVQSFPPAFEAVPFKPMFYDLAYSGIEFPIANISRLARGEDRLGRVEQEVSCANQVDGLGSDNTTESGRGEQSSSGAGILGILGGLWGSR
ncbi:hypothetical protein BASA50_007422 [Batrachochytrium salamandrivorans]|uniref:Signal recognition particle subunit SRP68 n=1 Tax=Batrachochytrium salamandrivorans TaxID=1357716 RepID=A0ABQ8F6P3_9FUNG|nr:hypothetical protein BASA61_007309 [Batrachochytrium salamandrivorans]KAH6593215.1 hypothetical protein BASA50_007422 [Batrachochytrium salamandrivorans]KAH9274118.1 hypothetical protein BASA83_003420 [Batrachochytrium salamandrivorans]